MDRAQQNQDSYDRVAGQYLERSRDRSLLRLWMHRFREQLPSDAPVLDLAPVRAWIRRSCDPSAQV